MDARLDVNSSGLTSTLISKLFDSLAASLDTTMINVINEDRMMIPGAGGSGGALSPIQAPISSSSSSSSSALITNSSSSSSSNLQSGPSSGSGAASTILSGSQSLRMSKSNTLIRKLANSGKITLDQGNDRDWANFARDFWFYYPSLILISESAKYCKTQSLRLVLDFLPRHVQLLQHNQNISSTTTFSASMSSNISSMPMVNSSNQAAGLNNSGGSSGGSIGRSTLNGQSYLVNSTGGGGAGPSSSLVTVLSTGQNSQTKMFSFESILQQITPSIYQSDIKYLDLIESTVEIVVADIITHILGTGSNSISESLVNRLRDIAFYYFKPLPARALNQQAWQSLRYSISDQWSLILGQISRISLLSITGHLNKVISGTPGTTIEDLISYFKGTRWISLLLNDKDRMVEVEKLLVQILMWIEGNKKSVLRLAQLESLDGMILSMPDYTISNGIVEKMKLLYKRAEKLLKHDDFEERSLKLMTTILTRGPNSMFEEEYDNVLKRLLKTLSVQKKRDFSLECILRLLQGRFVPPRRITGIQAHLSANSTDHSSIAAQLQQRLDRVYENQGSYPYAGLSNNRAKMIPRLQDIIQVLYGKKQIVPKVIECIDLLVAITVHIAVHSLKLLTDTILPTLFSNASPLMHVIALRTLSIILDPSDVFWNTSPSANSRNTVVIGDITYVKKEEIQLTFETFLSKSFKYCEEQSSTDSSSSSASSQDPLIISTQFEPTISLYSLISDQTTSVYKFESETTVEAIKRWYDVCTKTPEQREKEFFDQCRVMGINLMSKIYQWENSNQLVNIPSEPYPMKKKTIKKKTINPELLELFKETIRCVTFVPKTFVLHNTLHKLVLHEEEEIATAASHAIQVIMCDYPNYRTNLVQGYTSLILQYVGKDHVSLQTLLSQLLGLIDLWNERSFIESRHSSVPLDSSFYPPKLLETEIEGIGLVHLCSPNPQTRIIALQLIRSISGIRNTETANTQVASVLHNQWKTIVQRARHQLLLDNAYGIDRDLKLNPNDELPSAEEIASSTHDRLWAFILAEIGRSLVEQDCVRTLSKARGILLNILTNMPPIPTPEVLGASMVSGGGSGTTADDQKRYSSYTLRHLWINCHALLFSCSGIPSIYPLKPNPECTDQLVWDMINFEHALQSKVVNYLPTFWAALLSDYSWIREKLSFICGLLHWRLLPCVIDSLNKWWTDNRQNKKLARVRVDLSNIFRRISQHKDFPRALKESNDLIQVFVQFIQQIDPIFGDATKLPSVSNESYFNDNAVVVYNFCSSLYQPTPCSIVGPIRKSLVSSIRSIPWTVGERYKTFKAILQWSGHPKVSQARMQLEAIEINKRLSKAKDSNARDEEKDRIENALRKIRYCSRLAAESILRLGTLFEEGRLQQDVLDWVVDSEHKGNRILRWVLSYHFDEAYAYFLNKCYSENPAESVLYLHSIYDQYLPIPPANPPTLGITQDIFQFYADRALEERAQVELEDDVVTAIDRNFSRKLTEIGSSLLFLSCLNLLHPAFLARIRSFDIIARLSPCAFGLLLEEDEDVRSALLPRRQAFSSRISATNKLNALAVSDIVSKCCSPWTERLFEEAFSRFPTLNPTNKKWVVQFLLPWCDNISLASGGEHRLTRFTSIGFLKLFFGVFTESMANLATNDVPQELIDLWLALAKRDPINLTCIINFLIKKGIASKDAMPICKLIILHIYRLNPSATLEPLIYQLSYMGVVTSEKRSLSEDDLLNQGIQNSGITSSTLTNSSNDESKKLSKQQSVKIREACVLTITDLVSENLWPIMNHLHILFNYSLLRIDSTEAPTLTKMITVLLSSIRNSMFSHMFTDPSIKGVLRNIIRSIDTILTAFRLPTFQIKFNFHNFNQDEKNEMNGNSGNGGGIKNTSYIFEEQRTSYQQPLKSSSSSSITNSSSTAFKKSVGSPNGGLSASENGGESDDLIEHRDEMIKCSNGYIYVNELIKVLCKYFEVLSPTTIDKWESEALMWIKNYKDPRISIKACQTYRSIIHCQQMIPDNVSKTQTLKRQKTRWASSVELLTLLLQEWSEDLENSINNIIKIQQQQQQPQPQQSNRSLLYEQGIATFSRTLCIEILLAMKQIVESKNLDEHSISLIFWSSISFLSTSNLFYEPLYNTALDIVRLIIMEQKIFSSDPQLMAPSIGDLLHKQATEIVSIPRGIQYHLFKGILKPTTEDLASELIVEFYGMTDDSLVDPLGAPQRYLLPLIALTPWLHNKILSSKSSIIYKEQRMVADKIARKLAETMMLIVEDEENGEDLAGLPMLKLSKVFLQYSEGSFNSNPDEFLVQVCSLICKLALPTLANECADLIGNMLENTQLLSTSILKTTNLLLKDAPSTVIPMFKNIVRVACEYGSSSPVAGDLIHIVSSAMKNNTVPPSSLPPFLPPIDKAPSETIKAVLGPKSSGKDGQSDPALKRPRGGHRRNKSAIQDHPSLKEKALNEKKAQPLSPPKFSNVFNPQQQQQQQQQQQNVPQITTKPSPQPSPQPNINQKLSHNQQLLQPTSNSANTPGKASSVSSTSSPLQNTVDSEDYEFEFGDDEMINDIIDHDPLTVSMMQKAWRNSDEYNVYLDMEENDFEGIDELKEGLEGLDTGALLSKLAPTQSMMSINVPKNLVAKHSAQQQPQSKQPTPQQHPKPVEQPPAVKPSSLVGSVANIKSGSNINAISRSSSDLDSLRELLHSKDGKSGNLSLTDSYQIDQLLSNLDSLDLNKLDAALEEGASNDSPSSSFLNFSTSTPASTGQTPTQTPAPQQTGVQAVLADAKKRRSFLDFLKKNHYQKSVNDVCFVEVVNDFRAEGGGGGEDIGGDGLLYLMRHIVEGFVVESARHQISITDQVRTNIINTYQESIDQGHCVNTKMFDEALSMITKELDSSVLDQFKK